MRDNRWFWLKLIRRSHRLPIYGLIAFSDVIFVLGGLLLGCLFLVSDGGLQLFSSMTALSRFGVGSILIAVPRCLLFKSALVSFFRYRL